MICRKCDNSVPEDSRFCPFCGDDIRKQIKNDSGAGTKKLKGMICILSVLCVVFAGLFIFEYFQVQATNVHVAELEVECNEKSAKIKMLDKQVEWLNDRYDKIRPAFVFYNEHACIVPTVSLYKYYHKYGCSELAKTKLYMIYNTEAAMAGGYSPCPECH